RAKRPKSGQSKSGAMLPSSEDSVSSALTTHQTINSSWCRTSRVSHQLTPLGDELRHRALPTFTNILHTLAPPISSHERLHIHITHDLVGYPSLDPMIHDVFAR